METGLCRSLHGLATVENIQNCGKADIRAATGLEFELGQSKSFRQFDQGVVRVWTESRSFRGDLIDRELKQGRSFRRIGARHLDETGKVRREARAVRDVASWLAFGENGCRVRHGQ